MAYVFWNDQPFEPAEDLPSEEPQLKSGLLSKKEQDDPDGTFVDLPNIVPDPELQFRVTLNQNYDVSPGLLATPLGQVRGCNFG